MLATLYAFGIVVLLAITVFAVGALAMAGPCLICWLDERLDERKYR